MDFEPKILGIACNWCTYTGADLAGTTRLKYPQNVRTVRVMCSSRINPSFIIRAFQLGADGSIDRVRMVPASPSVDFSYDFQDPPTRDSQTS